MAVDLRKDSETFSKWYGVTLTGEKCNQLWIPPGFAHGFYVLSEVAHFEYKCTDYYHPEDEGGLLWNDAVLNVQWPLDPDSNPILSEKDKKAMSLTDYCSRKE